MRAGPGARRAASSHSGLAEHAVGDQLAGAPHRRVVQQKVPDGQHAPARVRQRAQLAGVGHRQRQRLFDHQVPVGLQHAQTHRVVARRIDRHERRRHAGIRQHLVQHPGQPRPRGDPRRARAPVRIQLADPAQIDVGEPGHRASEGQPPRPGADQSDSDGVHGRGI